MRYALVTGGSRGLGRAVCIKLAGQGIPVIINYQSNAAAAEEVKATIEAEGGTAELLPFNVSDKEQVDKAIEEWEAAHPEAYIAILVNNAGIREDNLMIFMQDGRWNGFFYVTRRALKRMLSKRFGRIINMASLSGIKGLPGQTNYSAAKAALIGATKALAQEVASRKVTVNAVAPGFISTDMTKETKIRSRNLYPWDVSENPKRLHHW